MNLLAETAGLMLADHKGLLAMDESKGTCDKRFAKAGIDQARPRIGIYLRQNIRASSFVAP